MVLPYVDSIVEDVPSRTRVFELAAHTARRASGGVRQVEHPLAQLVERGRGASALFPRSVGWWLSEFP